MWNTIGKISTSGVSLLVSLIIARYLSPEDYGLVGLLYIFFAIAQILLDGGFGNALVQKKDRDEIDYNTTFVINVVVGIVLYGLMCLVAPAISLFYAQPALTEIAHLWAINLPILALAIVPRSILVIELKFRDISAVALVSVAISGILGIWLAVSGYGYYALIYQYLTMNTLQTFGLFFLARWCPRFQFSPQSFKRLFSFGFKLLIGGVLNSAYNNLYALIIGKYYSPASVGYYTKANGLASLPSMQITAVIDQVAYPILCKEQDNPSALSETYLKYLRLSCLLVFPAMLLFAALSRPLVLLVLKEQWEGMIVFVQILSMAFLLEPLRKFNWQILNVLGRSDLSLYSEIVKKGISILSLFLLIPYDVLWVTWGYLGYSILDVCITAWYGRQVSPVSLIRQIQSIGKIAIAAIVASICAAIVVYAFEWAYWIQIFSGGGLGLGIYLGLCRVFKIKEIDFLFNNMIKRWM